MAERDRSCPICGVFEAEGEPHEDTCGLVELRDWNGPAYPHPDP